MADLPFEASLHELIEAVGTGELSEASSISLPFQIEGTEIMATAAVTVRVLAPGEIQVTPVELELLTGEAVTVPLSDFATHTTGRPITIVGFPVEPSAGSVSAADDGQSFTYQAPAEVPTAPVEFTVEVDLE